MDLLAGFDILMLTPGRLFAIYLALASLFIGSFLNVVIARVPAGQSVVKPRSRCPNCHTPIKWYDNLPLLSYLILRGKCRVCGWPIPLRYPLVELVTFILGVAILRRTGATPQWFFLFTFAALCVALTFIDLDTWLLPYELTWPGIALGILYHATVGPIPLWESAAGAAAGFGVLFLFDEAVYRLTGKEGIGAGDFFFFAMIGAFLGLRALPLTLTLAAIQGSIFGGIALLAGRALGQRDEPKDAMKSHAHAPEPTPTPTHDARPASDSAGQPAALETDDDWEPTAHHVPFGPFLALAALEHLFFGAQITGWYLSQFLGETF